MAERIVHHSIAYAPESRHGTRKVESFVALQYVELTPSSTFESQGQFCLRHFAKLRIVTARNTKDEGPASRILRVIQLTQAGSFSTMYSVNNAADCCRDRYTTQRSEHCRQRYFGFAFHAIFPTIRTGAEVSSFNSQPQAYSLSLFRVRLRLTVKQVLSQYLCTSA